MIGIILIPIVCLLLIVLGFGYSLSEDVYKGPISNHFDGKRFRNLSGKSAGGFSKVLKYMIKRKADPAYFDKAAYVNKNFETGNIKDDKFRITFVNHSTFLIETNKGNILTDPIWSRRCSPFQFAGPGRLRLPGIPFEKLPK